MSKVLVTGAAGFIGFHVSLSLILKGYSVIGIDNINDYYPISLKYDRLSELGIRNHDIYYNKLTTSKIYSNFSFMRLDIEDSTNLMLLFQKESFCSVIHLAAQAGVRYSLENPRSYIQSNVVGFLNILEGCRMLQVKHLLFASSSSVYGLNTKLPFSTNDRVDTPVSLYAATKRSNELMAFSYSHLYNLQITGLRFFTVYGPWGRPDMAPFLFTDAILNNKPIKVFNNGNMSRDFTYIDDIVNGILKICSFYIESPPINKYNVFNIGKGTPIPLLKFIKLLEIALGKEATLQMESMQIGDVESTWADITSLKNTIDYIPITDIEVGIHKLTQWYQNYYRKS